MKNGFKNEMPKEQKIIGQIIEDIGVCMLTSISQLGGLHSRPMYVQEIDEEGSLWFFTSAESNLMEEINKIPIVNVTFSAFGKDKFLSATALASEAYDQQKMKDLWTPALEVWFKDGIETPDITLLRIDLQEIEYWDAPTASFVKVAGLVKPMSTDNVFTSEKHEKITVQPMI